MKETETQEKKQNEKQEKLTPEQMYNKIYKIHFRFLAQNHMAEDRSRHLAVVYAVKNTWNEYQKQGKV